MVNFKNILESFLFESRSKDKLTQKLIKLGVNEYNAEALAESAGALTIFLAFKILEKYEAEYYENSNRAREIIKKQKLDVPNRMALVNGSNSFTRERNKVRSIIDWYRVALNGNIKPYENLSFDELYEESEKWHESLGVGESKIDYEEKKDIILDFRKDGEGFYWVALGTQRCSEEAERMGHCASSSGYLYSLREYKNIQNDHTLNKSHLTASITSDGTLLQLKGSKNSKPKSEFHKFIIPLLEFKGEDGFLINNFGYEYDSKNDFKLSDLTNDEIKFLYGERPELFNDRKGKILLQNIGLIEKEKRETTFILEIEPKYIEDYVTGGWVVSKRKRQNGSTYEIDIFETILSGDVWDLWQNYDADWEYSVDSISKENENKIITRLKELAGEEYDPEMSLKDAIEEFDDGDIKTAISSAVNDSEANEFHDYLYKQLKDALSEYGKVIEMNDAIVKIEVDLDNLTSGIDEEVLDEAYEACESVDGYSSPSCVLTELLGHGEIEKPDFNYDERWTPWGNDNNFNENLKWRLDEI